ncbi:Protein rer1a [Balamuthia mandrillaris]
MAHFLGGGGGGGGFGSFDDDSGSSSAIARYYAKIGQHYQKILDDVNPWLRGRWAATACLALLYCLRVYYLAGWYIVSYALGIYLLNLLIGFLSPQVDPEAEPSVLPTKQDDEFKPFVRRLPEFKFWHATTRAFTIAFLCTFTELFNIPVFWPILLLYFILLFFLTMKRQLQHMWKHKYIPFDLGKPKFGFEGQHGRFPKDSK